MAKSPKAPVVDRDLILELTKLLEETGLTEIEIEQDGQRVRVARNGAPAPAAAACTRRPRHKSLAQSVAAAARSRRSIRAW